LTHLRRVPEQHDGLGRVFVRSMGKTSVQVDTHSCPPACGRLTVSRFRHAVVLIQWPTYVVQPQSVVKRCSDVIGTLVDQRDRLDTDMPRHASTARLAASNRVRTALPRERAATHFRTLFQRNLHTRGAFCVQRWEDARGARGRGQMVRTHLGAVTSRGVVACQIDCLYIRAGRAP
jgi:hypothetical protein